jgi:coenzyme F420 biosynthesis associated uncharacterized protein
MSDLPISWSSALAIATRVSGHETFGSSYLRASLDSDFERLTEEAIERVTNTTGLQIAPGNRLKVVDRPQWVAANIASFQRILAPVGESFNLPKQSRVMRAVSREASGAQVGAILGWMSRRVLGQYDMLLDPAAPDDQDFLYYVAPNILSLEKRFGFPPEEFRLWIALHECTHRAQFTGVEWMVPHFRSLVNTLLSDLDNSSERTRNALGQFVADVRAKTSKSAPEQFVAAVATPEQRQAFSQLQGLMALLEGHAEVVMSRAGEGRISDVERFKRVIAARRKQANLVTKFISRVIGIESKLKQYGEGAAFVRAVERAGGRELFDSVWASPENLPNAEEIKDPKAWIRRQKVNSNVEPPA